jgi:cation diffusion facilitator CzcD-associated flavoprotein CzcO
MSDETRDRELIRQKYAEERAKRMRADGPTQYLGFTGDLVDHLQDTHLPVLEREPLTDHVTFAFIGAGFAGLVVAARLRERGIDDIRMIDKAGDFGGTWYWNRYPGIMCDSPSLVYMPLLEETGYMPTEKYAHGPEIQEYCRRLAKDFDLYDNALFHTEVTSLAWDDARSRWRIGTNRGDSFSAQFVGMGLGLLQVPKLPGIPGIDDFAGQYFHTSRWDYAYTGGDPAGAPMTRLADKRVAIIGTGATAIQVVPELAKDCGDLYVFQRTPSSVDVRGNGPIDPDWFAGVAATPGWQQRWIDNFATRSHLREMLLGFSRDDEFEDLVQDGWTAASRLMWDRLRDVPVEQRTPELLNEVYEDVDFELMTEIRARVDSVVGDPDAAAKLKAWYRQFCKRPCFHDEYLQAFNRPSTHLIDTDGKGVERITEHGVVANGQEYEVDCIIYSSGFFLGAAFPGLAGFNPTGRDGKLLSEYWAEGFPTLHGIHMDGFPNLFYVQMGGGATQRSSVTNNFVQASKTIATVVDHVVTSGFSRVEAAKEAVDAWSEILLPLIGVGGDETCTPSYLNNEGHPLQLKVGFEHPDGSDGFFKFMEEWRQSGTFDGLSFR